MRLERENNFAPECHEVPHLPREMHVHNCADMTFCSNSHRHSGAQRAASSPPPQPPTKKARTLLYAFGKQTFGHETHMPKTHRSMYPAETSKTRFQPGLSSKKSGTSHSETNPDRLTLLRSFLVYHYSLFVDGVNLQEIDQVGKTKKRL